MAETHLDDWVVAEKQRIDKFHAWWMKSREADKRSFPLRMSDGEWDEQLIMWRGEDL